MKESRKSCFLACAYRPLRGWTGAGRGRTGAFARHGRGTTEKQLLTWDQEERKQEARREEAELELQFSAYSRTWLRLEQHGGKKVPAKVE